MALALAGLLLGHVRAIVHGDADHPRFVPSVLLLEHLSAMDDLDFGAYFGNGLHIAGPESVLFPGSLRVDHPVMVGVHSFPRVAKIGTLLILNDFLRLVDPLDLLPGPGAHHGLDSIKLILLSLVLHTLAMPRVDTILLMVIGAVGRIGRPIRCVADTHIA